MSCRRARAKLQPFLDRALLPAEETHVREHLGTCEPCRRQLDSLRLVDEALSTQPTAEPPAELAPAIMARAVSRAELRRRLLIPAWLEAWTLASVALGLAACGFAASHCLGAAVASRELAAQVVRLLPVVLAAGFGLLGLWYYRP